MAASPLWKIYGNRAVCTAAADLEQSIARARACLAISRRCGYSRFMTSVTRICRVLLGLGILLAVVLSLLPQPPHLPIDSLGDKFEHSLAFVVLTLLAAGGFPD